MNNDAIAKAIENIDARLGRMETRLSKVDTLLEAAPNALGAFTDSLDDMARDTAEHGASFYDRGKEAHLLIERATRPEALRALSGLINRLESLEKTIKISDQFPGAAAAIADSIDHIAMSAIERGIDLPLASERLAGLVEFAVWGLQSKELSGLFESQVLRDTANAWAEAAQETPKTKPKFSFWRVSRDADIRRALDFATRFAKKIGVLMAAESTTQETEEN